MSNHRNHGLRMLFASVWILGLQPLGQAKPQDAGQPLASNIRRLVEALDFLGQPLPPATKEALQSACRREQANEIEALVDPLRLVTITINPESKVKAEIGPASPQLQQAGFTPFIVKVVNQGRVKSPLRIQSPQAGPSYGGVTPLSMERQDQRPLRENEAGSDSVRRFLYLDWYSQPPMAALPSGVEIEYGIMVVYTSDSGTREAVFEFSVGQSTQDLGFRAQVPILFECRAAIPVELSIREVDTPRDKETVHDVDTVGDGKTGAPFAKLTIRDQHQRIYPPQIRRLAPDFFFQEHVYRCDGERLFLPAGQYTVESSRGPEYKRSFQNLKVEAGESSKLIVLLERWIHPQEFGWYSGDHHIHGAGCAHYESPTKGVTPEDMFRQISGEGLNVGCVLTWGPCFEFQRQFFRPEVDLISRPNTIMKYDLEISGFGSQALGHVCLLNLKDQTYPGSEGTKEKGWPSWTTPALRWAKQQGAVTGFAHSASGLQVHAEKAAQRVFQQCDENRDGVLSQEESAIGLLPESFDRIDVDQDKQLSIPELQRAIDLAADRLPNLAVPEMDSVGAMELPVAVVEGVCDFISAMDTPRIAEWNMWYHLLNCGFPLKVSGETDFPCMSGTAVGQGRSYVQMGDEALQYAAWCRNLALGRCYVSDGYAHAIEFEVEQENQKAEMGESLALTHPGIVQVHAKVAFAPETPESLAHGTRRNPPAPRWIGDTVTLHGSRSSAWVAGGPRLVELVANGVVVASKTIEADGQIRDLDFEVDVRKSSWLALRCFPQLHTNVVEVLVADQPIRASAESARWCEETIHQLWRMRKNNIHPDEKKAAEASFQRAIDTYRMRASECR